MDTQTEFKPENLTDKEYRFANYYLSEANLNATEAARLAGYSEHTARQQGSRLLSNVYIEKYIQSKSSEILLREGVTQERVLKEIVAIAFTAVTDFFNDDWTLKSINEIDPEKRGALNVTLTKKGYSIKTFDRLKALLTLWELFKDESKLK